MRHPLLTLLCLALVTSCSTDITGIPLTGAPFVSAAVNGAPWTVDSANIYAFFRTSDSLFYVSAERMNPDFSVKDGILVTFRPIDTLGTYLLSYDRDPVATGLYYVDSRVPDVLPTFYSTVNEHVGSVQLLSLDSVHHVATGRFEFDGQQLGAAAIITVRAGQFRVRYGIQ